MASRQLNRLGNAKQVAAIKEPGWHGDGGGLYLRIQAGGARSWVLVDTKGGKRKERGLGSASTVTLAQAREKRDNPTPAKSNKVPTFGDWSDEILGELLPGFKNEKHRGQWKDTLQVQAASLRKLQVDAIDTDDVLDVLRPIWRTTNETASRLRGRIERILDAARAKGHIQPPYENPARWKGHLEHFLARKKKTEKGHHKAMPYADIPAFMPRLRALESTSALALEVTILCATRTTETAHAKVRELNLDAAEWTIPAERMKMGIAHTVPLVPRVVETFRDLARGLGPDDYLFPGGVPGKPLSNMAMLMCLRGLNDERYTVHGFRSTFRDWAGDETDHARDIAEMALAHGVGDETEQAYRRGSGLRKRRVLMEDWAAYLEGGDG